MKEKQKPEFICTLCNQVGFRDRYNLNRHLKTHADEGNIRKKTKYKICPMCEQKEKFLNKHLLESHAITVEKEYYTFYSAAEFSKWKKSIEIETKNIFVKHHGTFTRTDGIKVNRYYCHRDGSYHPRGKGIRKIKSVGSNKINSSCPACIKCTETSDSIKVEFTKTHVGHTSDAARDRSNVTAVRNKIPVSNNIVNLVHGEDYFGTVNDVNLENLETVTVYNLQYEKRNQIEHMIRLINGIKSKVEMESFKNFITLFETTIKNAAKPEHVLNFVMQTEALDEQTNDNTYSQTATAVCSTPVCSTPVYITPDYITPDYLTLENMHETEPPQTQNKTLELKIVEDSKSVYVYAT